MTQILQIDKAELHATLSSIVRETFLAMQAEKIASVQVDRITDLNEVEALTGLKKSVLYKLTSTNEIPFSRFGGKRLVFSRTELLRWIESRTVSNVSPTEAMVKQLAATAKKKGVRG